MKRRNIEKYEYVYNGILLVMIAALIGISISIDWGAEGFTLNTRYLLSASSIIDNLMCYSMLMLSVFLLFLALAFSIDGKVEMKSYVYIACFTMLTSAFLDVCQGMLFIAKITPELEDFLRRFLLIILPVPFLTHQRSFNYRKLSNRIIDAFLICFTLTYLISMYLYLTGSQYKYWMYSVTVILIMLTAVHTGIIYIVDLKQKFIEFRWEQALSVAALLLCVVARIAQRTLGIAHEPAILGVGVIIYLISVCLYMIRYTLKIVRQRGETEIQLQQNRLQLAVSQIKPHFVYNALGAIGEQIDSDKEGAKQSIDSLSRYLRALVSGSESAACVPVMQELNTVRAFTDITALRWENMNIEYDIRTQDFCVPALSVQPLVENAIKHGLRPKRNDRVLRVSTWEDDECFHIRVEDNGVGFDLESCAQKEDVSVGIANTRYRLKQMINAELNIISEKDKGTIAEIIVPKE